MEGEEAHLPGLEMDHKQLFFLNFAQVSCAHWEIIILTEFFITPPVSCDTLSDHFSHSFVPVFFFSFLQSSSLTVVHYTQMCRHTQISYFSTNMRHVAPGSGTFTRL